MSTRQPSGPRAATGRDWWAELDARLRPGEDPELERWVQHIAGAWKREPGTRTAARQPLVAAALQRALLGCALGDPRGQALGPGTWSGLVRVATELSAVADIERVRAHGGPGMTTVRRALLRWGVWPDTPTPAIPQGGIALLAEQADRETRVWCLGHPAVGEAAVRTRLNAPRDGDGGYGLPVALLSNPALPWRALGELWPDLIAALGPGPDGATPERQMRTICVSPAAGPGRTSAHRAVMARPDRILHALLCRPGVSGEDRQRAVTLLHAHGIEATAFVRWMDAGALGAIATHPGTLARHRLACDSELVTRGPLGPHDRPWLDALGRLALERTRRTRGEEGDGLAPGGVDRADLMLDVVLDDACQAAGAMDAAHTGGALTPERGVRAFPPLALDHPALPVLLGHPSRTLRQLTLTWLGSRRPHADRPHTPQSPPDPRVEPPGDGRQRPASTPARRRPVP